MFQSTLEVAHVDGERWRLTKPLVWQGRWQYIVIRSGFETDFASIPKPVRWLLDNAGRNAEAAVLHDAVWRESKRPDSRIDPWLADGIFRRALHETGSPALTRGLMWFAVRLTAMVGGRVGRQGPSLFVKVIQLLLVLGLGTVTALGPTLVAGGGLLIYWLWNWISALAWHLWFERRSHDGSTNWPWPFNPSTHKPTKTAPPRELLIVASFELDPTTGDAAELDPAGLVLAGHLLSAIDDGHEITEAMLDEWLIAAWSVREPSTSGSPMLVSVG
jgi:Protein of unknown function (DUF1353)